MSWIFWTGIKAITLYCDDEIKSSNMPLKEHKGWKNLFLENEKAILVISQDDSEGDFHKQSA